MTKVRTTQLQQMGATTGQVLVWSTGGWLPGAYDDATKVAKSLYSAKGVILVGTGSGTTTSLAVGVNNSVLMADSATASGVKWATPVDSTKIPLSTVTTKGDLIVGSASGVVGRLPAGTNGDMLVADSAQGLGLRWKTPDAVTAAGVSVVPFSTIAATNVQAALEEIVAESGSGGGAGGGHVIEDEGVALAQRPNLNFVGVGVTASDDPANNETRVEVTGVTATSAAFTRQSVSLTTAALDPSQFHTGLITLAAGYRLYQLETSRPARVRLYENATKRDADLLRTRIEDPPANSGLMLDYVTKTGALVATLSPLVDGYVQTGTDAAISIQNIGTAGTVTVTLVYLRTE